MREDATAPQWINIRASLTYAAPLVRERTPPIVNFPCLISANGKHQGQTSGRSRVIEVLDVRGSRAYHLMCSGASSYVQLPLYKVEITWGGGLRHFRHGKMQDGGLQDIATNGPGVDRKSVV